jgi:hypothetical protein
MTVKIYHQKILRGTKTNVDARDVAFAAAELMEAEHLEDCAVRYEDGNGSGGWMLIGEGEDAIVHMPIEEKGQ